MLSYKYTELEPTLPLCVTLIQEQRKSLKMLLYLLGIVVTLMSYGQASGEYRIVCYYESWAVYNPGRGMYDTETIDPSLCTHLVYTFVGVGEDGSVQLLDEWNDIELHAIKNFTQILPKKNPKLKTMVAIGGWNEGSEKFSKVVNDMRLRAKFVQNIVDFVKKYGFSGFDIDWEYPAQRGGSYSDVDAFTQLLKDLRPRFDQEGLLLSAAVSAGVETVDTSYDVPGLAKYLDWINVMAYDLHGSWDDKTGINAPLYPSSEDEDNGEETLNVDAAIKYWIQKGAPAGKINLGLGFYGNSFTLQNSGNNGVGAPVNGAGQPGPYTQEAGTLGYDEICLGIKQGKWTSHWNNEQKVPYAVNGNQWVGYDNIRSIKLKAQYILDHKLGGAMIWAMDMDDFNGDCGDGKYPLLHTLNDVLDGKTDGNEPTDRTEAPGSHRTHATHAPITEGTPAPPPPPGICKKEGYVRDPNNCAVYYRCINESGNLVPFRFECTDGTVFDPSLDVCNFPSVVEC